MKKILISLVFFIIVTTKIKYSSDLSGVNTIAQEGTVALTFDDGPSPVFTPKILNILKKHKVKATFFVMGWAVKKFPYIIDRMKIEGHSIASHTNSHEDLTKLSRKKLDYEINMPKEAITKARICPLEKDKNITVEYADKRIKEVILFVPL